MPGAETRMQAFARELFGWSAEATPEEARRSSPSQVAPLVVYLLSEECEVSGELFYAGHGHVRRVVLGSGDGIVADEVTPELIAKNWDRVMSVDPFHVAGDVMEFRDSLSPIPPMCCAG